MFLGKKSHQRPWEGSKSPFFWSFFGPPKWPYVTGSLSTRCENTYIYFCEKDTHFCGGKCLLFTCKNGNAALLAQAAHFFALFRAFLAQNRPKMAQKWPFFGPFLGFATVWLPDYFAFLRAKSRVSVGSKPYFLGLSVKYLVLF